VTYEPIALATKVVIPMLGDLGRLVDNLIDGARTLMTASAELRSILLTGLDRLDVAEAAWKQRDKEEDERVAKLNPDETKP
jgi:hypothetical protein